MNRRDFLRGVVVAAAAAAAGRGAAVVATPHDIEVEVSPPLLDSAALSPTTLRAFEREWRERFEAASVKTRLARKVAHVRRFRRVSRP